MLDAEQIAALKALEKLDDEGNPVLLAEDLVTAAADADHPMHDRFQWDDSIAGHQYRLVQARSLIRVYVLKVTDPDANEVVQVHAYGHLRSDRKGYRPIDSISGSVPMRETYLRQFVSDLAALRKRYATIERFLQEPEFFQTIDAFIETRRKAVEDRPAA